VFQRVAVRSLLFLCGAAAAFVPAFAWADSDEPLEVKEVVVSSTRLPDVPVDVRTLPAKVTVITAEDIRKSGAKTVQEALQWTTGIVMFDQNGNAFQQTIDMRGFNGQPVTHTAVFVDGMRMNEPDFNAVSFDLIPFDTIERIEVIPGAAAIYGKNAMGGVINIITKRGTDKQQVTGETLFGSFHRERYTINASGPVGKFDYYANFGRETENGFRNESDAKISRFTGKLGYRPSADTDLSLSYTYVNNHLLGAGQVSMAQAFLDRKANASPGDFFASETNVVRFNGRQSLPLGFSLSMNGFYRQLAQDNLIVSSFGRSDQLTKTESRGGTVQLTHEATPLGRRNTLVLGSEFQRNDFGQTGIAASKNASVDENVLGLYAQDTLALLDQVLLTTGVRYDHDQYSFSDVNTPSNNASLRFSGFTPRAGLTYLVRPDTSVYFNYSQGFRNPFPSEVFATQVGALQFSTNTGLRPARSNNYEVGLKKQIGQWGEGSFALFQSDVQNDIVFGCTVCQFGIFTGQNINIPKTRRRGFEGTIKARYEKLLDVTVNYTYLEAVSRSQYVNSNSGQTVDVGDTLPLVPKHRLSVTGNYHPADGWTLSLIGLYVSTQIALFDESNQFPGLPGYFQLNSRIAYERPVPGGRLSGFLLVNNLLDQKYFAFGSAFGADPTSRFVVPAPGIAIYGGLSYRFEGL
jgi:iron complex outermembrane receptor protein